MVESISYHLYKELFKILNVKHIYEFEGEALRNVINQKYRKHTHAPRKIRTIKYDITMKDIEGQSYYVVKPVKNQSNKKILYIHGGGYFMGFSKNYWPFLASFADNLGATIIIPLYPLIPEHSCDDVFNMLLPIYKNLLESSKALDITIMGDSAGGGISLSLAQLIKEKKLEQPKDIILISPCLNMAKMTGEEKEEMAEINKKDIILSPISLETIGIWWAGARDRKHYLVSPMFGELEGLGKISLFASKDDCLYVFVKKFCEILKEKNVTINYYENEHMMHCWPLFPMPEGRQARDKMIEIIGT